jgi:hypothetical protein
MTRLAAILAMSLAAACAPTVGEDFSDEGGGGSGGGGGGGQTNGVDAGNCASVSFTATQVIPSIQLLIDRSGSMAELLPGTNTSRYAAMRDALVGTTGVVAELQAKARFGASLYTSDATCPRLYNTGARDLMNFQQVKTLIESQQPQGNTPTPGAIDQAVALFAANPPPMGSPPIIVLATDGLPNSCSGGDTQNESVQAAKNAYTAGIRTFILGIDGLSTTFLQNMANAGTGVTAGMPNSPYYTANSPASLKAAFQQIIGGVVSCELALNGTIDPAQAANGTVSLNGSPLQHGTDWEAINSTTIRLIGGACDTLKNSTNPTVSASFPCGAVIL